MDLWFSGTIVLVSGVIFIVVSSIKVRKVVNSKGLDVAASIYFVLNSIYLIAIVGKFFEENTPAFLGAMTGIYISVLLFIRNTDEIVDKTIFPSLRRRVIMCIFGALLIVISIMTNPVFYEHIAFRYIWILIGMLLVMESLFSSVKIKLSFAFLAMSIGLNSILYLHEIGDAYSVDFALISILTPIITIYFIYNSYFRKKAGAFIIRGNKGNIHT
ncbi:MAG: hypothetical protein A2231_06775 [Candidatus Firestonebacteria bacterium RIFOXYA2_FULL_40_8]|nr:MAG: hypothetical protein A2231_06775 [Candidatus Firestonebacteria bacterium RIFOXYA2_FULL_40_8]